MKKAYLSIASLLACITLASCNSGEVTSSNSTTPSESTTTSSESTSSSVADVFTYKLELEAPSITTYEVGDAFDFASIVVKEQTFKNGTAEGGAKTLTRSEFVVKVNGQVIEGNFTFASAGEVEFLVASAAHSEATATFKLTAVQHYTLTNGSADKVVLTNLPEKALSGESITFGVTLLPGYYLENGVKVLNDAGEEIESHDNGDYTYTFTMPAGNVTITINTGITDFTISKDQELIGDILVEDSEDTTDTFSAVPGTKLKFQAQETIDTSFTAIYVDGVVVTKGEDDYYHFVMPHHPVVISAERVARDYSLTTNISDLTASTAKIYTNTETKENVSVAHKGQKVYLAFDYTVVKVNFEISVKATVDGKETSLEVTPETMEGVKAAFSFTMISANVTITVKEEDCSKYYNYYVTNKLWKTWNLYGSTSKVVEKTLDQMTSVRTYEFKESGKGTYYSSDITWTVPANTQSGVISMSWGNYTNELVYYTPHIILGTFGSGSAAKWTDANVGTWDENTTVHALIVGEDARVIWTEGENREIAEKLLIYKNEVYTDFGLFTDSSKATIATGDLINEQGSFYVSLADNDGFDVVAGNTCKTYNLSVEESPKYTVTLTNKAGETIASSKNGETVYATVALTAEAGEGVTVEKISASSGGKAVIVTATENKENTWEFTMPKGDVQVSALLNDPNKMKGHTAVGVYRGFNLFGSNASSSPIEYKNLSSYNQKKYEVTSAGKFRENDGTSLYNLSNVSEGNRGTFTQEPNSSYQSAYTWNYGGNIIVRPYSSSSYNDVNIAVKEPENFDVTTTTLVAVVHWINDGESWALEFRESDTVIGSVFMTNKTFYCGATFEMTGESTRIGKDATYTVKLDGQAIFTVANETVTAAE